MPGNIYHQDSDCIVEPFGQYMAFPLEVTGLHLQRLFVPQMYLWPKHREWKYRALVTSWTRSAGRQTNFVRKIPLRAWKTFILPIA